MMDLLLRERVREQTRPWRLKVSRPFSTLLSWLTCLHRSTRILLENYFSQSAWSVIHITSIRPDLFLVICQEFSYWHSILVMQICISPCLTFSSQANPRPSESPVPVIVTNNSDNSELDPHYFMNMQPTVLVRPSTIDLDTFAKWSVFLSTPAAFQGKPRWLMSF